MTHPSQVTPSHVASAPVAAGTPLSARLRAALVALWNLAEAMSA